MSAIQAPGVLAEGEAAGTPVLTIRVLGTPAPQGSKSAFRNKYTGRIQQVESSKKVKPWREAVKQAAADAIMASAWERAEGPVELHIVFVFARPKSHFRTGRNAHLLRDDAPHWRASTPDISKTVRATEDALTDAGVWRDDGQVVHVTALKVYEGRVNGLPGAHITIREATP